MGFNIGGRFSSGKTLAGITTSAFITEEEFYSYHAAGEIYSWGENLEGTHGTGNTSPSTTPTTLATNGRWRRLARTCSNAKAMAAIDEDGLLYTWGYNTHLGKLFNSISNNIPERVQGDFSPAKWKDVAVSTLGMAAIAADGTLWAWGDIYLPSSTPTLINSSERWSKVFGGSDMFAAIDDFGLIYFWGKQTGLHPYSLPADFGYQSTTLTPVQSIFMNGRWSDFSSDSGIALAVNTNGSIWGFGSTFGGVLYNTSGSYRVTPEELVDLGREWRTVSTARDRAAGIKKDGTLWTWGNTLSTGDGYLGQGFVSAPTLTSGISPNTTTVGGSDWASVGMGYSGFVATKKDGTTWGTHTGALTTLDLGNPIPNEDLKHKSSFHALAVGRKNYHLLSLGIDQHTGAPTYLSPYGDPIPTLVGKVQQGGTTIIPGPGSSTTITESATSLYITHDSIINARSSTVIYWKITGTSYSPLNISAADSSDFSSTSGSYTVSQGGQSIGVTIDSTTEGTEGFVVEWAYGAPVGQPGSITLDTIGLYEISDTSTGTLGSPVYGTGYYYYGSWGVDSYLSPEEEGNPVTHVLSYSGFWSQGTQNLYVIWRPINGMSSFEVQLQNHNLNNLNWSSLFSNTYGQTVYYASLGTFNGNFSLSNINYCEVYITPFIDSYAEPGEGYYLDFRLANQVAPDQGYLVAQTGNIAVSDAPWWNLATSPSTNIFTEGDTITLNLTSGGQSNQTLYYVFDNYSTPTSISDFESGTPSFSLSGSTYYTAVTHNNNSSSLTYKLKSDGLTESTTERFRIKVLTGDPVTGTQVALSTLYTINDPAAPVQGGGNSTFIWRYYAYGATVGNLTLYWRRNTGTLNQLRFISGAQHSNSTSTWNSYSEDLSNYNGQTGKIVFRYLSGSSFTGDVQLDNMVFTDQFGNITNLDPNVASVRTSGWQKYTGSSTTSSSYPSSPYSNVTITTSSSGRWNYDTGGTPSGGTGGTRDADGSSTGYYIYYETSSPNYPSRYGWLQTTSDLTI